MVQIKTFPVVNMNEIESVILSASDGRREAQGTKSKNANNTTKELFKNGILVETNKGLVFMSLKDALNQGVDGHSLSPDFQSVTTQLFFQEEPQQMIAPETVSLWTDTTAKPKKTHKQVKKSKSSKAPTDSFVQESLSSSQEHLDELKIIQESLLGFSSLEYPLLEKGNEESEDNKKLSEQSTLNKKSNIKPVISVQKIMRNLSNKKESNYRVNSLGSLLINSGKDNESCVSNEETSDNSEVASGVTFGVNEIKPAKKRGGWPKGRKRKPEIKYEIRPPKAPATGYVIFLNEKRKDYRDMPFTEVTKLLGNEWSKLSLQDKKVYLDQAEVEKKRYREELKVYRQSDAYQMYLNKKRLKRLQGNGTEESDMDATDEIDEEDNEELYCRSCDQWFHSLHNKKEHLYGRQHLQSIAGRYTKMTDPDWCNPNMSSTSLDESSLDGSSYLKGNKEHCCTKTKESLNMDDAIVRFMVANKEREEERKVLRKKLEESKSKHQVLSQDLQQLNETLDSLTCMMESERTTQILLEQRLFNLLNVPTLFYLPEPLIEENS